MKIHDQGFFGQKSALLFNSGDWAEPYAYLKCIKKTPTGWEKPSNQEGKTVKLSLTELIALHDVLRGKKRKWTTVHQFQEERTSISVGWQQSPDEIWFAIADYRKKIQYPETTLFHKLLAHIIEEKIEYSTTTQNPGERQQERTPTIQTIAIQKTKSNHPTSTPYKKRQNTTESGSKENSRIKENTQPYSSDFQEKVKDVSRIEAKISNETDKAILLVLENKIEHWFPKTAIVKGNLQQGDYIRPLLIKNWILKTKKLIG